MPSPNHAPASDQPPESDERFMRLALELAAHGCGHVEPNPMVGCVLVRDGRIISQGYHAKFGGPHAEVAALAALASPQDAAGATAYVTLEPCCHTGKTPPCTEALIGAGAARVFVAMEDPFAMVSGGGIARLRQAGLEVHVGLCGEQAMELTAPFVKRVRHHRPWVIAKWAMTIDGRIATASGQSQWITGQASRHQVHQLRGRVDAIAVGMGTVQADDPMLTARPPGPRVATRVVFCRHRLPALDSKLVRSALEIPVMLIASPKVDATSLANLQARGVQVVAATAGDAEAMVGPALEVLADQGATNVMLEGGSELFASFFSAGEVDECHVFIGGKAFGGTAAPGPIGGLGVVELSQAWAFRLQQVDRFEDDVRLIYRR